MWECQETFKPRENAQLIKCYIKYLLSHNDMPLFSVIDQQVEITKNLHLYPSSPLFEI